MSPKSKVTKERTLDRRKKDKPIGSTEEMYTHKVAILKGVATDNTQGVPPDGYIGEADKYVTVIVRPTNYASCKLWIKKKLGLTDVHVEPGTHGARSYFEENYHVKTLVFYASDYEKLASRLPCNLISEDTINWERNAETLRNRAQMNADYFFDNKGTGRDVVPQKSKATTSHSARG